MTLVKPETAVFATWLAAPPKMFFIPYHSPPKNFLVFALLFSFFVIVGCAYIILFSTYSTTGIPLSIVYMIYLSKKSRITFASSWHVRKHHSWCWQASLMVLTSITHGADKHHSWCWQASLMVLTSITHIPHNIPAYRLLVSIMVFLFFFLELLLFHVLPLFFVLLYIILEILHLPSSLRLQPIFFIVLLLIFIVILILLLPLFSFIFPLQLLYLELRTI